MRWRWLALCLWFLGSVATAVDLPARQVERCVRAAVKIGSLGATGQPMGSGSGTMIDSRGYILTNFHVVGSNETGELNHPQGRVLVATPKTASESARYEWVGQVVRAAPRLDLALVRITGRRDGAGPLPKFSTLRISSKDVGVGAVVWTFGFPSGTRSVNVSKGIIAGLEMNLENELSWLRTDAEINPGNSGGMMVDSLGQLVGVPTLVISADGQQVLNSINVARSVEQIPGVWLQELRTGHISGYKALGVNRLVPNETIVDTIRGNNIVLNHHRPRYYGIPRVGAAVIEVSPPMEMAIIDLSEKTVVREGVGRVPLLTLDPENVALAVPMSDTMEESQNITLHMDTRNAAFEVPPFRAGQRLHVVPESFESLLHEEQASPFPALMSTLVGVDVPIYMVVTDTAALAAQPGTDDSAEQAAADAVAEAWRRTAPLEDDAMVMVFAVLDSRFGLSWQSDDLAVDDVREVIRETMEDVEQDGPMLKRTDQFLEGFVRRAARLYESSGQPEEPGITGGFEALVRAGASGAPMARVLMLVGRPGTDIVELYQDVNEGRQSGDVLEAAVLAHGASDDRGRVRVTGLPPGQDYQVLMFIPGFRIRHGMVHLPEAGGLVDLGVVEFVE